MEIHRVNRVEAADNRYQRLMTSVIEQHQNNDGHLETYFPIIVRELKHLILNYDLFYGSTERLIRDDVYTLFLILLRQTHRKSSVDAADNFCAYMENNLVSYKHQKKIHKMAEACRKAVEERRVELNNNNTSVIQGNTDNIGNNNSTDDNTARLDGNCFFKIFSLLERETLLNCASVNRRWRVESRQDGLWKDMWARDYNRLHQSNPELFVVAQVQPQNEENWFRTYANNYTGRGLNRILSRDRAWCTRCNHAVLVIDIGGLNCINGVHRCQPMSAAQVIQYVISGAHPL